MARLFLGMLLVVFVSGCASMQQPSAVNSLQIKVAQLEKSLDEKDQQISDLKDEVQELSSQVDSMGGGTHTTMSAEPTEVKTMTTTTMTTTTDDERIIRVPVSASEVQTALKNGGYYKGPIDGKVGAQSKKAIADFQKDHNLKDDGIVGKNTWIELKKYLQ